MGLETQVGKETPGFTLRRMRKLQSGCIDDGLRCDRTLLLSAHPVRQDHQVFSWPLGHRQHLDAVLLLRATANVRSQIKLPCHCHCPCPRLESLENRTPYAFEILDDIAGAVAPTQVFERGLRR